MTQRAQFIPSISRSIASILKTTNYASLRYKITLLGMHDSPSGTDSLSTEWELQRLAIQRSLWRVAQKQVYKPGSSRNLCFADPVSGTGHTKQSSDDILFSESCDDLDSLEYYFGADDEALSFGEMDDEDPIIYMKEDMSEHSDGILRHSEVDNAPDYLPPAVLEDLELFVFMHDLMISHLGSEDILQPLSDEFSNESIEDMLCDEL